VYVFSLEVHQNGMIK